MVRWCFSVRDGHSAFFYGILLDPHKPVSVTNQFLNLSYKNHHRTNKRKIPSNEIPDCPFYCQPIRQILVNLTYGSSSVRKRECLCICMCCSSWVEQILKEILIKYQIFHKTQRVYYSLTKETILRLETLNKYVLYFSILLIDPIG